MLFYQRETLEFKPHPLGDEFPVEIRIIIKDAVFRHLLSKNGNIPYIIPIDTNEDFVFEIFCRKNQEYNNVWQVPHVTLFDLRSVIKLDDNF